MSKDLATLANNMPAHLRPVAPEAADDFTDGIGESFPLPFLSIKGKEFRFRKDGQEVNTRKRELSVVMLAARPAVSKRFYAKKYESGADEAPDCSSMDGVTPDVAEPVSSTCAKCPNNAWGSKITEGGKEGKACADYKRVILWAVDTLPDNPLVLDLSATNMRFSKEQRKDRSEMDFKTYVEMLKKHGMAPHQVVTNVAFTAAEYPQLCFAMERFVTEEEWEQIGKLREGDDIAQVLKLDAHTPPVAATSDASHNYDVSTGAHPPTADEAAAAQVAAADEAANQAAAVAAEKKANAAEKKAATAAKKKAAAEALLAEKEKEEIVYLVNMETDEFGAVPERKTQLFLDMGYTKVSKAMYDKLGGKTTDGATTEGVAAAPEVKEEKPAEVKAEVAEADDDDIMAEVMSMFSDKV